MIEVVIPASDRKLAKLSDLKEELGITDTSQDTLLTRLIEEASDIVRTWCGREFVKERVAETVEGWGDHFTVLTRTPVTQIVSVELNGTPLDTSVFTIDDSRAGVVFNADVFSRTTYGKWYIERIDLWYGEKAWKITYDGGWDPPSVTAPADPMPRDIQRACIEISKMLWHSRNRDPSVVSVRIGEASETRIAGSSPVPPFVKMLLDPWKRVAT